MSSMSSLGNSNSSKPETDKDSSAELGVRTQSTSCYSYQYPGHNGPVTQLDNHGHFHTDGSHKPAQSENGSMIYYMPGYNPYANGSLVGIDGQCLGQQPYISSTGYLQHPVSYGSEAMSCYAWDAAYPRDAHNGNIAKYSHGSTRYGKSNGSNSLKTNGNTSSRFTNPTYTQPIKNLSEGPRVRSDFSEGFLKAHHSAGKFSAFTGQKQGAYGPMGYRLNGRMWNGGDRYKLREKTNRNGDFGASTELTCGPRAQSKSLCLDTSVEKEMLGLTERKDLYNLPTFQTEYENAKFYVIKSYSEDDIHKSIKYDVWSSTPNGNKKLDAAYRDAEARSSETGTKCPIFLFFSVNGSGQFVGLAEMIGQVDFDKDMDFWQLDKWNGFFPVKWHIIKDIPNGQLRHIILENNDNRPVTYTRDTQEIGLKQGLEMLSIFKTYSEKSSLLDDFSFYENREMSRHSNKGIEPASLRMEIFKDDDSSDQIRRGERKMGDESVLNIRSTDAASLIDLTKSLSLNDCTL